MDDSDDPACTTFDLDDEIEAVDGRPSDKIDASPRSDEANEASEYFGKL